MYIAYLHIYTGYSKLKIIVHHHFTLNVLVAEYVSSFINFLLTQTKLFPVVLLFTKHV